MRRAVRRVLAQDTHERGLALPLVIGITAALAAVMVAGIAFATGALRKARDDQDWSAALAAAYAGVEEFESRLAYDTGYVSYGNPAAAFSAGSDLELPVGPATNPAFGLGASGTWAEVAGSGGASQFRYEVDNTKYSSEGTLRIRSTGRSGGETRTIVADLKQQGFIDFLYFTDYEVTDPQAVNPNDNVTDCAIRYPASRPCDAIYFGGSDTFDGPVHTNDAIQSNGPTKFLGRVTTGWKATSGKNFIRYEGTAPTFDTPTDPAHVATIGMPATNSDLKKETRTDLPEVPVPGCLYTGPTSIEFLADGRMTVISPWTRQTNTAGDNATSGTSPSKCGTPGSTGLAKMDGGRYVGQTFTVPTNTVIYVQDVPTASTNVNYVASSSRKPSHSASAIECKSDNANNIGYPLATETTPFASAYKCRTGDLFVKGTMKGRATLAAERYVYVTGDLKYRNSDEDMLGLVGNNAVWVWNPLQYNYDKKGDLTGYTSLFSTGDRTVEAAILSVSHTFMVQNYNKGGVRGDLYVKGAIAQKFRGPVATTNNGKLVNGYGKKYSYDRRFRTTAPPKFLSPVTTTYGISVWVEVSPAFDTDGTYR
jgi:hypothetical protein